MNINIETKYNIGDTVYIAEHYDEFFPSKPLEVIGILIKISPIATLVEYKLQDNGYDEIVIEPYIFATYEECVKWCDNHNY